MIGIIHRMYPSDGVLCCGEEENIRKNEGGGKRQQKRETRLGHNSLRKVRQMPLSIRDKFT